MPNSYTIIPGQNETPKKHNWWIFVIAIISVWLILGGIYFWLQTKSNQPLEADFDNNTPTAAVTEETNTNTDGGRLNPAGQKETGEEQMPESFLGYIKKIENQFGNNYILIDYIEWVVGEEAKQAALAAGDCTILEACAPNGFYIRNESTLVRRFRLSANPEIRMQTYSNKLDGSFNVDEKITTAQFLDIFTPDSKQAKLALVPYQVKVTNGEIVEIREKYVP